VKIIDSWIIVFAFLNLLLLIIGVFFLIPKNQWKVSRLDYKQFSTFYFPYLFIVILIVIFHLIEVNLIDPFITTLIKSNYTSIIQAFEDGIVHWISQYSIPALTYVFVFMYIVLYPFTLWFTLLYFILTDQRKAMKTFAFCFSLIYGIALPFYLFVPITNVYTYYGTTLTLNTVFPGIERFFYATTTSNNCFPSLHVAMTLLVTQTISLTNNKRYKYFAYFCAIGVIISVIYLAIHWITDVLGGVLLAFAAFYLVKRFTKEP
jgi:membrane-associated phospholipid phosphatase